MKKIISLLLALACAFALFSCGGDDQNPDIAAFANILADSEPTKIVTNTSYNDGDNTLVGTFETQIFGSDFVMEYNYQTYPEPSAGMDPEAYIVDVPGTVYYHDGLYSTDKGATWGSAAPDTAAMGVKINLDSKHIKSYSVSSDKKTLTVSVDGETAEQILGMSLSASDDKVRIIISHDGNNIRSILVMYTTVNEATVQLSTSYSYSEVVSPFEFQDGAESDAQ
jgi:hypothetical protein